MKQDTEIQIMTSEFNYPKTIKRIEQNQTNCYLLETDGGFILIDTGFAKSRQEIESILVESGCTPENLKLIILTHGDFDHTGNCAYLRSKYDCKVAMHYDDLGMVEKGDFFWNRENRAITKALGRLMFSLMRMNLRMEDRFSPDLFLEDMQDLSDMGMKARVIHVPGHSKGSIGILTDEGDFFCGDLFVNTKFPDRNNMLSNASEYESSIRKVMNLGAISVYPGHGKPFLIQEISEGA
ncbi:MAG: MBL fold metallo-hydrolase [Candidatus Thorarchaeota archaeon]